jgi:UDP:flavonoid glycosyltransferase YjiC (YdhE family)
VPQAELEAWRPHGAAYRPGARLVYTGPLFARLDLPVPPGVQPFLDRSRPTAYVVLSSSTPEMLRTVVARVRAAGLRVIVGATIHDFGPVDDADVVVAGILPSHVVMPRVHMVVCMGGQGTVQCAMASGVPLVGIPLHPEQELNVDLAVRHGMGLAMAPRHADTARLTDAVRRVVHEPAFAVQAQRVQCHYTGFDGATRAADAIRAYLDDLRMREAAAA